MQTVAELRSDKAPEQEKETASWEERGVEERQNEWGVKAAVAAMWEMSTKYCVQENVSSEHFETAK